MIKLDLTNMSRLQKVSTLKKQMTKVASEMMISQSPSPDRNMTYRDKHLQSGKSMMSIKKGGANIQSIDSMNPYMSSKQLPMKDIKDLTKKEAEKVLRKHLDSYEYYSPTIREEETKHDE